MGRPKGSVNKKSIWLMESLAEHGYDYEKMLTKFLLKAASGDQVAYGMAQLLVKMVPYLANMPKQDTGTLSIDTLVINRYVVDAPSVKVEALEATLVDTTISEGIPPSVTDGQNND